ncbi:MAG TPA: putative molybdenum carrier protein [Kofleriaceae bacterium]|nr:putative molybdenum carrier protein [Kofleriaceae bacterium]
MVKIISGGQTGADRGALDAARDLGVAHGGFCPRGRRAEDGVIPAHYDLVETRAAQYAARTAANVRAADATLLITRGKMTAGSALTARLAEDSGCPFLHVDLARTAAPADEIKTWLAAHPEIATLNVAGPRESGCPGIAAAVRALITAVLR